MTEDIQIESGFLSLTSRENWTLIIKIHQLTKELSIWAEEIGFEEFGTFLQPWAEIRSAYDHIIRAKVEDLGLWKEDKFKDKKGSRERDEEYIKTNMDKALGHQYRAFFDAADYFSLGMKEDIIQLLKPFNYETILRGMPDYTQVRIRVAEISEVLARLRCDKDIGCTNELIPVAAQYRDIVYELKEIRQKVYRSLELISSIHEEQIQIAATIEENCKLEKEKSRIWQLVFTILGAILGILGKIIWDVIRVVPQ